MFSFKNGPFPVSFSLFASFLFKLQLVDKTLPVLGFEPQISGVGSDHSTNWAAIITEVWCLQSWARCSSSNWIHFQSRGGSVKRIHHPSGLHWLCAWFILFISLVLSSESKLTPWLRHLKLATHYSKGSSSSPGDKVSQTYIAHLIIPSEATLASKGLHSFTKCKGFSCHGDWDKRR